MPARNDAELHVMLAGVMKLVVDEATESLLFKLRDLIIDTVYSPYEPEVYERQMQNGGVLGMFDKTKATIFGNEISSEINNYPDSLTHDPENFIHGSLHSKLGNDVRDIILDIITQREGFRAGPLFGEEGWWRESRDFWQKFEDMIKNGQVDNEIEAGFRKYGIQYIKR